jgi:hypothetical protein
MRTQSQLLAALAMMAAGCATVVHGPYQDVRIDSNPPGANATVSPMSSERGPSFLDPNKKYTVTTPATVRLRRDNNYRVEVSKPGYKIATAQVQSSYDWLWSPYICGPCEAAGQLPTYDLKGKPLPLRFVEAAFYEYPKGFFRAWGRGLRVFNPDAWLGNSFKLAPKQGGVFSDWHGLGTPDIAATLEPTG